jgi:hypothetical protein
MGGQYSSLSTLGYVPIRPRSNSGAENVPICSRVGEAASVLLSCCPNQEKLCIRVHKDLLIGPIPTLWSTLGLVKKKLRDVSEK